MGILSTPTPTRNRFYPQLNRFKLSGTTMASLRLIALGGLVLAVIVHAASLPDLLRREFEEKMMEEEEKKTINVEEPEEKEVEAKEEGTEVAEEEVDKKRHPHKTSQLHR